jgi:hypothetical protein
MMKRFIRAMFFIDTEWLTNLLTEQKKKGKLNPQKNK